MPTISSKKRDSKSNEMIYETNINILVFVDYNQQSSLEFKSILIEFGIS